MMDEYIPINLEKDTSSQEVYPSNQERTDGFLAKVTELENTILIINIMLEIPSAVLDQLSSVDKPQYALVSMLMSYFALLISVAGLAHKGKKARVSLMMKGWIPWFYYPYPNHSKPFGKFFDIMGLICGILQCVFTSVAYSFLSTEEDNPIKVNFWPLVFAFGLLFSKKAAQSSETLSHNSEVSTPLLRTRDATHFTMDELSAATNDFSEEDMITYGSFGPVHRGKLRDGREVVIKRREFKLVWGSHPLFGPCSKDTFDRELWLQIGLSHKNLVGLVGYCTDEDYGFLVYEYMKNGTLWEHLHYESNAINSWKMRINILLDAATGIHYLHNQITPIFHRRIKSSYILLDANWNARVSGFVLAGCCAPDFLARFCTKPIEYVSPSPLDQTKDIYNFGVVLLEVLTGKIFINIRGNVITKLVDSAVSTILDRSIMLDPRVGLPKNDEERALDLVTSIAVHCLNFDESKRPTMNCVVASLERSLSLCDG